MNNKGETALMKAVANKQIIVVQAILSHSAMSINAVNSEGKTALLIALGEAQNTSSHAQIKDIVQLLIDHGANPNILMPGERIGIGYSALSLAEYYGCEEIADLLRPITTVVGSHPVPDCTIM